MCSVIPSWAPTGRFWQTGKKSRRRKKDTNTGNPYWKACPGACRLSSALTVSRNNSVATSGEYRYVGKLVVGFDKNGELVAIDEGRSGPVRVATGDCGDTLPCDDAVEPDEDRVDREVSFFQKVIDALAAEGYPASLKDA